jgi:hypothetical protein
MEIDRVSRLRAVRLLFIIGILFALGFSITGLLIKESVFAIAGFTFGSLFFGMGIGFNYLFQRKDSSLIFLKYFKPLLYISFGIQILLVLINLSVE